MKPRYAVNTQLEELPKQKDKNKYMTKSCPESTEKKCLRIGSLWEGPHTEDKSITQLLYI